MKKLLFLGILFLSQSLYAQFPLTKDLTAKYELISNYNQTKYIVEVSLPVRYDASKKYPVYYILDGYYAAAIAHGAHRTLQFENLIEDVIGLVAPSPSAQNERPMMLSQRSRSFSRSASVPVPFSRSRRI